MSEWQDVGFGSLRIPLEEDGTDMGPGWIVHGPFSERGKAQRFVTIFNKEKARGRYGLHRYRMAVAHVAYKEADE